MTSENFSIRRLVDVMSPRLISSRDAASYLGVSPQTLAAWRARGVGPAFVRFPAAFGRNGAPMRRGIIGYRLDGLEDFVERWTVPAGRLPRDGTGRLRRVPVRL
jgi:hypothetical protein